MDFTWSDIQSRLDSGFYDADAVAKLKDKNGEDEGYTKKDYKIYETIVVTDVKKEGKSSGKFRRYIITFDDESKIILRAMHYHLNHNKIFYVVYTGIPKDDSWQGYSFAERLEDVTAIANSFINSAINEFTLAHSPIILTDDKKFDGGRHEVGNLSILTFDKGSQFLPTKLDYSSMDRIAFINWAQGLGELIIGASASLMSGKETPADPRAPASKTAMKLAESNARVEDIVINLQKGDEMLAEQVDKIYYQYPESDKDKIEYFRGGIKKEVDRGIFARRVRYVCHGSRLSFDKSMDLQIATQTIQFLMGAYPEVWQDAEARYELLNIVLNNSQGSVEKNKDILLRPIKNIIESRKRILEIWKAIQEQGGKPTAEQDAEMRNLIQSSQMMSPGMGQGQEQGQKQ